MAEQEQPRTFNHAGWTFSRLGAGGAVRIANLGGDRTQITITPEGWASIVASMGEGGETHDNWRAALAFHQDAHSHGEPTHLRAARQQVVLAVDAYLAARSYWIDLHDAQDQSFAAGVAKHRAWLELHDAEARLIALRATLGTLEARHEARRAAQRPLQGQEPEGQGDPGDEQPRGGGDTSPVAAHSPVGPPADVIVAAIAAPQASAAPADYVADTYAPLVTLLTQPNVTGIAPASLHRLASLAAGDGDLAGLQGWFARHAATFTMAYRHADRADNEEWCAQASVALHDYRTTGIHLRLTLRDLARQVLTRHGQFTPGEAL